MKVSVVIPTYKRNNYILRAIDSVLEQNYSDVELIVVDDNGIGTVYQQETKMKLSNYIGENKIKYICNEKNVGGAIARNNGIEAATGEFVTFLDDDDVYLPGKIEVQVNEMVEKGLDLCVMDGETYDRNGHKLSHKVQPLDYGMTQEEILKAHIVRHITGTNVFMYKRDELLKIGMFDNIPAGQEFMLMLKSITNGLKIGCIHDVYVHFHIDGQERISSNISKIKGLKQIYKEKEKYFNLLTKDEVEYIKSKHHGTLFYVYYLNHKYINAALELFKAVISSPKYAWENFQERKGKLIGKK